MPSFFSSTLPSTEALMDRLRCANRFERSEQVLLVTLLSVPAIIAQLASVLMHYIDMAMLGHLGSQEAAGVGLVSTTIWMASEAPELRVFTFWQVKPSERAMTRPSNL